AGASGRASTFVTARDEESVRAIERIIRMSLPRAEVPREDAVFLEELEEFQAGKEDAEPAKYELRSEGTGRGRRFSRREAPGRGGSSARAPARRQKKAEVPRGERSSPSRRG